MLRESVGLALLVLLGSLKPAERVAFVLHDASSILSTDERGNDTLLKCTPFLLFDGNCAEAMTFYHECLGGELTLTKLGDSSMKDQLPPEKHDRIINAHLKRGDFEISATDWMASPAFDPVQGNTSAIFVVGDNYDELKAVFDKLAHGAEQERFQELHEMPVGTYGQFYDQYGVQWIFLTRQG